MWDTQVVSETISGGKESSHFGVRSVLSKNTSNAQWLLVCYVAGAILSAPLRLTYWTFTTAFEGGTVITSLYRREHWGTERSGNVPAATHQQVAGQVPSPGSPASSTSTLTHMWHQLSPPLRRYVHWVFGTWFLQSSRKKFHQGFLKRYVVTICTTWYSTKKLGD